MLNIDDYKPLESKPATQPVTSQDWAVRLAQLLTQHTESLPEDLKGHLGNYRNAITILSNEIIRKALASQRLAMAAHFNNHGLHDAARMLQS